MFVVRATDSCPALNLRVGGGVTGDVVHLTEEESLLMMLRGHDVCKVSHYKTLGNNIPVISVTFYSSSAR